MAIGDGFLTKNIYNSFRWSYRTFWRSYDSARILHSRLHSSNMNVLATAHCIKMLSELFMHRSPKMYLCLDFHDCVAAHLLQMLLIFFEAIEPPIVQRPKLSRLCLFHHIQCHPLMPTRINFPAYQTRNAFLKQAALVRAPIEPFTAAPLCKEQVFDWQKTYVRRFRFHRHNPLPNLWHTYTL